MTGTVLRPVGVTGTVDMSTGRTLSPAYVNAYRITAVTNRLLTHVRGEARPDTPEFCNLCLSLARGIDYAVSNNEIPSTPDLPYLLKQVCQRKNDLTSRAAIMVLMISVKSACNNGWFSEKEKDELYALLEELQSSFCSVNVAGLNSNMKNKDINLHPTVFTIMSRFYPGLKMGAIFSMVETMPGYDSYVTDLYISKSSRTSPNDKIYLFVAQTDNIETSSCLISPQQVNFLLNGEGVDRRNCLYKDPGPQMPTPVTHMLKYGSNLLQVVGRFNARYIIVVGFMSVVANPIFPPIPDYVPPVTAQSDPDNEIIEGPSRISLKCPISFGRIKIPVKGHSCKHLQCFDFNNYVEINSRRPHWRCPHCSQSVCFRDIRIDQSMAKVLKEVGEDVSYVKISGDGSWEAVTENISTEQTDKPNDAPPSDQETITQNEDDIMDLTENDNEMEKVDKEDDKKSSSAGESSVTNKKIAPHMEDGFWSEYYSTALGSRTTTTDDAIQRNHNIINPLTQGQSQIPVFNNMQSQQNENSNNNGNGQSRHPPIAWVARTQNAIQALPAQSSARTVDGDHDRQQNFSRSHLNQQMSSHAQTPPQVGASSASPQQISSSRQPSPLSTDRFNLSPYQLPHVRPGGAHGGVGTMTSLSSSQSPTYSLAAIQLATSQIQSSGTSPGAVAATADQRGSSVDASAEENWRPAGRMRGSLSGWHFTEALKSQSIIQPSQPVQAARPPPVLNSPRPFLPPHLQALMANNPRPQAGGGSPGSGSGADSNMAGAPGSDK